MVDGCQAGWICSTYESVVKWLDPPCIALIIITREECDELRPILARQHQNEVFAERAKQIEIAGIIKAREKEGIVLSIHCNEILQISLMSIVLVAYEFDRMSQSIVFYSLINSCDD